MKRLIAAALGVLSLSPSSCTIDLRNGMPCDRNNDCDGYECCEGKCAEACRATETPPPTPGCESNNDCSGGRQCCGGECLTACEPPPECERCSYGGSFLGFECCSGPCGEVPEVNCEERVFALSECRFRPYHPEDPVGFCSKECDGSNTYGTTCPAQVQGVEMMCAVGYGEHDGCGPASAGGPMFDSDFDRLVAAIPCRDSGDCVGVTVTER